ncbi:hypothetical protein BBJ28_00001280 [Nothophytophthora sp. Chile5]|nr:hypothetical protein BBJ28_00001280 [Nothophytophthora sp. Chile5]
MGKSSVAQVPEAPPSASREVFQGLFKDLGKQAMALEAILRAVCGRVDKMENWLTEVSYGMTELDLKLRNIAHNIDGTAAVDDEAHGPRRWAIPPPEDAKSVAPTVSKKIGAEKKAVRVTGMAAAILDRLAAGNPSANSSVPVEDRNSKKKKKHMEAAGAAKKHHNKKTKGDSMEAGAATMSVTIESAPVEDIPSSEPVAEVLLVSKPEVGPIGTGKDSVAPLVESAPDPVPDVTVEEELNVQKEEPTLAEIEVSTVEVDEQEQSVSSPIATVEETQGPLDQDSLVNEPSDEETEISPEIEPPAPQAQDEAKFEPLELLPDASTEESPASPNSSRISKEDDGTDRDSDQDDVLPAEASPAISARDQVQVKSEDSEEIRAQTQAQAEIDEEEEVSFAQTEVEEEKVPPPVVEASLRSPPDETEMEEAQPTIDHVTSSPVVTKPGLVQLDDVLVQPSIAATAPTTTKVVPPAASDVAPVIVAEPAPRSSAKAEEKSQIPSKSTILPTVQVERVVQPVVLTTPVRPATLSARATTDSSSTTADVPEPPTQTTTAFVPLSSAKVAAKVISTPESTTSSQAPVISSSGFKPIPPVDTPVTVVKVAEPVGLPLRSVTTPAKRTPATSANTETLELPVDPLVSKRNNSNRRASINKLALRHSLSKNETGAGNPSSLRPSGTKRDSHSRHPSIASPPKQPAPPISTPASAPEPAPTVIDPEPKSTTAEAASHEESEESEESDGGSSPHDSGSSSEDSDEQDDDDDDDEQEERDAAMSHTMTALKKLKKANVLSPEEEDELKQRAHKKWFQLKGHLKEKQKKDVTNILLKRKKNVFTVSSRIELLEEKSREIYAALKQMTNELRDKTDRAAHDSLRRHASDIEKGLQAIDARLALMSAPAMEKVSELQFEVSSWRTAVQLQLTMGQEEAAARHKQLEAALSNQSAIVEAIAQDLPTQLKAQADLFSEQLKHMPDYSAALEGLRRSLRRKADLKLLKELEARLLGLDAENEDCLVRCLSCRKEVINPHGDQELQADEEDALNMPGGGASQLRKVNPGPASARIYRSNVPFSAQPLFQETITEETSDESLLPQQIQTPPAMQQFPLQRQLQSAGDSRVSEKPLPVRSQSAVRWSTPSSETLAKREAKTPRVAPIR